ncbi:MAG: sulfotransferase [Candidatus Thermoplasmatota archaeon]
MIQKNSPDDKYLNKIKDTSFEPIFIVGQHRSGTSILYKILDKTNQFNVVRLYHILEYEKLLYNHIKNLEKETINRINNTINKKNIDNRGSDHISISAESPVEYVFVYAEYVFPWYLNSDTLPYIETLCKKIKYISENEKPILLKNPFDFSTFLFIKKMFPNSKFIFIHRNPIDVLNSLIRMLEKGFTEKNEYFGLMYKKYKLLFNNPISRYFLRLFFSTKIPIGLLELIRRSSKNVEYYLKNIDKIPEKDYVSIKYEDLCNKPNQTIGAILDFLDLKTNFDASRFVEPRHTKTVKSVEITEKLIYKTMKEYFENFGYTLKKQK